MIDLTSIKNIIFDLGNVLLDVDPELTSIAFKKLGINSPETTYKLATDSGLFIDLELGKISEKEFRNKLREFADSNINDNQIDIAWNAMLLDIPENRLNLLLKLANSYKLYLLSNTNQIHYKVFSNQYAGIFDVERSSIFTKTYYSHILNLRKPEEEIFIHLIENAKINPNETLFIDDLKNNISTAKKLGFKTKLKISELDIVDLF